MATTYEIFDVAKLTPLVQKYETTFRKLNSVEITLSERFHEMGRAAEALVLAVACGEPLLFIGPPGTGKSRFIRVFCDLVGLKALDSDSTNNVQQPIGEPVDYFEYLLTPFTEPGELFGHYNITKAQHGQLVRDEYGMMQTAKVVYLDEVFNGSSAILNSLLSFIQERRFHDRDGWQQVPLQCLFAATNDIPGQPEMRAIYDRFTFRCWVDNVTDNATTAFSRPLLELLEKGWLETYGHSRGDGHDPSSRKHTVSQNRQKVEKIAFPGLLDELDEFRKDLRKLIRVSESSTANGRPYSSLPVRTNAQFFGELAKYVDHATRSNLGRMSNRRLVRLLFAMLVHRIYRTAVSNSPKPYLTDDDFQLLVYFLDRRDRQREQQLRFEAGR